jgi:arylsulfatase A-like enzyme/thioredoxin-like negative regulator of GroEL
LVTIDTTRWDSVDASGGHTPTIGALASQGVWFERAYSPVPLTLPAHTTLMTGSDPPAHGVRNNGTYIAQPDLNTLAEMLAEAGYSTAAAVGAVPVTSSFGLSQGFQHFDEAGLGVSQQAAYAERSAAEVTDAALAAVSGMEGPWFLWVHYFDPHQPWIAPSDWSERYQDPYLAEIAYTDAQLGRLLEGLPGDSAQRIVVVTSDHGESMGEHSENTHGYFLHDATLRVPLVMAGPGIAQGVRSAVPARLQDIVPTIMGLLNLQPPDTVLGRNLSGDWRGETPPEVEVYGESVLSEAVMGFAPMSSMYIGDLRLVRSGRDRLFDLVDDPGELEDVSARHTVDVERLGERLDRYIIENNQGRDAFRAPDEETSAQLLALGYMDKADIIGGGDLYDAKELLSILTKNTLALSDPDAIEAFMARYPDSPAVSMVGLSDLQSAGATEHFSRLMGGALQRWPENTELMSLWLNHLIEVNQLTEANEVFEALMTQLEENTARGFPISTITKALCASASYRLGQQERAAALLEEYFSSTLYMPEYILDRGRLRHQHGDLEGAERDYRRAVHVDPTLALGWFNLAYVLGAKGRMTEALEALERGLSLDAQDATAWARHGRLMSLSNQEDEANESCRKSMQLGGEDPWCLARE